ncbi:glutamate-5-semialdehyde dehydrogenase [Sporolactobacillus sp. THM19-2]|jgi:glutamate-5-semialdehyde dehydrogenase|uniref:glutamate-5-semialdehyde dehydrogenase n=1 Tax=Sporolactobacillus sp. THM19-2 TaxID=2511171 RepID=UPI00101F2DFF|nr:glutamate-5-semialdehyde dehydrogenase [Sporolactobacillus sp. THM19-2]RYL93133.1 glutamate-5-semialdehyde dehydrogenase [Sporolactobacillus sp. THM19-2]
MSHQIIASDELLEKAARAKRVSSRLAILNADQKNKALSEIASALQSSHVSIIEANKRDLDNAQSNGMSDALLDRLLLNKERIDAMAQSLQDVVCLHDPIGDCLEKWDRPNGLHIQKMRVPLGVVGMVYEARPNVTVDATSLCLKTGNAVFLRGSRSALQTNHALVEIIHKALSKTEVSPDSVQLLEDTRHETVNRFFRLNGLIDVLIPRGSKKLIQTAVQQSTIPVLETGAGNCHLFIDKTADPDMAVNITLNAKTQRPSVCNSIETVIIQKDWFTQYGNQLIRALKTAGVECRIDEQVSDVFPDLRMATEEDWETEYLDKVIAVRIVRNVDEAINHINRYGTRHSESIISETPENVHRFFQLTDASTLYHNASTRFTDGEAFGFGAEIGISTQKLHARGPMGLNALTSIKYIVEGDGQIRE